WARCVVASSSASPQPVPDLRAAFGLAHRIGDGAAEGGGLPGGAALAGGGTAPRGREGGTGDGQPASSSRQTSSPRGLSSSNSASFSMVTSLVSTRGRTGFFGGSSPGPLP